MPAFPTTRWSLIQASDRQPDAVAAAWVDLVRDYRPAILAFFRRSALARDAEDLAQEFLLRSMHDGWWSRADPEIGSFRRFLLVLLQRFLATQTASGYRRFERTGIEVEDLHDDATPERQFDFEFALCLTRTALARLHSDYADSGRGALFDALQPWLSEQPERGDLAALGAQLQTAPNTLAVQLKRLRARFQQAVRAALADLSLDEQHANDDLDALRAVLVAPGASR
jgi:DNA-directed RNA polymerase specialized sigma24 family protein